MAHKYEMHRILDHALSRLQSFFTDDAGQWRDAYKKGSNRSIKLLVDDAVIAVNLAHLTQTFSVLPTALYMCCQLPSSTIVSGVIRNACGPIEKLSDNDVVRCMDARVDLARFNLLSTFQIWNPRVSHLCTDTARCSATLEHQTHAIREGSPRYQYSLSATIREVIGDVCVCAACEEMLQKRLERLQRRHWADLPHVFDVHVPGWGERVQKTIAATDNDSYGGDGWVGDDLEEVPGPDERAHYGESVQDAGLQDAANTAYGDDPFEEQTDADTYANDEPEVESEEDDGSGV